MAVSTDNSDAHPPKLFPDRPPVVLLGIAGGATAVAHVLGEQGLEMLHNAGLLLFKVVTFADISLKIVQLDGRQACTFGAGLGKAPAA